MSLAPMARLSAGEPAGSAAPAKPTPDQKPPTKKVSPGYLDAAKGYIVEIGNLTIQDTALVERERNVYAQLREISANKSGDERNKLEELRKLERFTA
jgi:hypothetical protein